MSQPKIYSPTLGPNTQSFDEYSVLLDAAEVAKAQKMGLKAYYSEEEPEDGLTDREFYNLCRTKITAASVAFPDKEFTKILLRCIYDMDTCGVDLPEVEEPTTEQLAQLDVQRDRFLSYLLPTIAKIWPKGPAEKAGVDLLISFGEIMYENSNYQAPARASAREALMDVNDRARYYKEKINATFVALKK